MAVSGRASVRQCAELRRVLLELLGEKRRVTLDLAEADSSDVAFAQLLIAAHASFEARQQSLEVDDPAAILAAAVPCGSPMTRQSAV